MGVNIEYLLAPIIFLFGLCMGSFLNVIIYRLPRNLSIVEPGSFCPHCGHPLSFRDNIPVISYLLSLGRCRHCGGRISIRYPAIELVTAIVFFIHYKLWGVEIEFFTRTIFFFFVIAMAFIDGQFYIIPDRLSVGGLVLGLVLSFLPGDLSPQDAFVGSIVGGALLFGVGWLAEKILKKEAMGMGDVKMMAMVGSFIGLRDVLLTIFLGSLLGTLVFGPLNLRKRRLIPFGVFLGIGGMLSIYFSDFFFRFYNSTVLG